MCIVNLQSKPNTMENYHKKNNGCHISIYTVDTNVSNNDILFTQQITMEIRFI